MNRPTTGRDTFKSIPAHPTPGKRCKVKKRRSMLHPPSGDTNVYFLAAVFSGRTRDVRSLSSINDLRQAYCAALSAYPWLQPVVLNHLNPRVRSFIWYVASHVRTFEGAFDAVFLLEFIISNCGTAHETSLHQASSGFIRLFSRPSKMSHDAPHERSQDMSLDIVGYHGAGVS